VWDRKNMCKKIDDVAKLAKTMNKRVKGKEEQDVEFIVWQ